MNKKRKYVLMGIGLVFFVLFLASLTTRQCHNYRIQSISLQKVNMLSNDTTLIIDNENRNYYLLHFDFEYCNCTYKFFDAPNPYFIKGSVENIINAQTFDSNNHNIINKFKALNLKNVFIMKSNGQDTGGFYCSSGNFNEIIQQINERKGYGERNNIEDDCLLYLDDDHNLPQKIILYFSTYSIECPVNNNPINLEIEKFKDSGEIVFNHW